MFYIVSNFHLLFQCSRKWNHNWKYHIMIFIVTCKLEKLISGHFWLRHLTEIPGFIRKVCSSLIDCWEGNWFVLGKWMLQTLQEELNENQNQNSGHSIIEVRFPKVAPGFQEFWFHIWYFIDKLTIDVPRIVL